MASKCGKQKLTWALMKTIVSPSSGLTFIELLYHMCRLFGTSLQNSWVVILVNFTSIFLRTCETSDYENWTVSDGVNTILFFLHMCIHINVIYFDSVLGTSSACWERLGLLNVASLVCVVGIVDNMNE